MTVSVVVALIGLIIVILAHTVVIARWSGRIDGYLSAASENFKRIDCEIGKLRDARHVADGKIQLHDGQVRSLEARLRRLDREAIDG